MAELQDRDIEAIHETHDKVIRIETLLGNGDKGLLHDVKESKRKINRIELVIVGLCSSGGLAGGILGMIKWLSG